jgi:hypothetical protein
MPFRHQTQLATMPSLTTGEWRDVQSALRAVQSSPCPHGAQPGPLHRSLARIGRFVPGLRARPVDQVSPELQPLRDFLCESARHGPRLNQLAERLEHQGYSPAQIAALTFIAG